jgi:PAT family beta-lactamase induction signal transducer AmpG
MSSWLKSAVVYREPRILGILFLGFSSGLPFLLTLSTLQVWLKDVGFNKATIGLFALVTIPYSLKFIWAPLIDQFKFPVLSSFLGHRKGWMLASQLMLVLALIFLGQTEPAHNIYLTACAAFLVSFFSATQDIVVEAYRIELLDGSEIGAGAGASNLGYRLGMWASGAGALYLASNFSWGAVYGFMAFCMTIGILTTLLSHEPQILRDPETIIPLTQKTRTLKGLMQALRVSFSNTFNYLKQRDDWSVLLAYILFFKLADTALNVMATPFLLELGFSKLEIAHVGKSFGIGAMIAGGLLASVLLSQRPLREMLFWCASLQCVSALLFLVQSALGHNIYVLIGTIGIENFSNGMGAAAFITYLSMVCRQGHAGAHFAFLTSIASFARVGFSYSAGIAADLLPWSSYYALTALLCLPNCILILWASRSFLHPLSLSQRPVS